MASSGKLPLSAQRRPLSEALAALNEARLARYAPAENASWFVRRVLQALEVYYSLERPEDISRQIQALYEHTRHPDTALAGRVASLSTGARELIERNGPIPALETFENAAHRKEAARHLQLLLVVADRYVRDRRQARRKTKIVGTLKRENPGREPEQVLASLVAAAYAGATGRPATRSGAMEERDDAAPFVQLLQDVLIAIGIDDRVSVSDLVRRHQIARNSSNNQD
jgi:hypothetical protein